MARTKAAPLFLVAVLVLAIVLAAFVAKELRSGVVLQTNRESSTSLQIGATAPAAPGTIMAGPCDGCSGGGGGG